MGAGSVLPLRPVTTSRTRLAAALGLLGACFQGEGTIGAVCSEAADCGPQQACRHELCGRCGNGSHEAGEVCYADALAIDTAPVRSSLRVVDVDDDDRDELLGLDDQGALQWIRPAGTAFTAQALPLADVTAFVVTDLDDDGDTDVLAAVGDGVIALLRDGESFTAAAPRSLGHTTTELALVPTDAGLLLVSVDDQGGAFAAPLGGDAAPVAMPSLGTAVHLGPSIYVDGDDHADLVVVDHRGNRLQVLLGDGATLVPGDTIGVGRGPRAVLGWDRTGDGRRDFLTLDHEGRTVTLVDVDDDGSLSVFGALAIAAAPTGVTAIDVDFDDSTDLVVSSARGLWLWRGPQGQSIDAVQLFEAPADGVWAARFGVLPVFDLLALREGVPQRFEVDP